MPSTPPIRRVSPLALLFGLAFLLLHQGCTPTGMGLDLEKVLTKNTWEVASVNFTFNYGFEERYDVPNTSNWREISQTGEVSILFDQESRTWKISESYYRQDEGPGGRQPSTQFTWDTTLTDVYGEWEFSGNGTPFTDLVQRYSDQGSNCATLENFETFWATDPLVDSIEAADIIGFEFQSLLYRLFGGDIVLYPRKYWSGRTPQVFQLNAKVFVDGDDVILRNVADMPPQSRSSSFNQPDYGEVTMQEDYSQAYFEIRLTPKSGDGCQAVVPACDPNEFRCENGTLYEGELGLCQCECETGWIGESCDQPAGFTWVSTVAGAGSAGFQDGVGANVQFDIPMGIATMGQSAFVSDGNNHIIRQIDLTTRGVSSPIGSGTKGYQDGPANQAQFESPLDLAFNPENGDLYIADVGNRLIRKYDSDGNVTTVAGVQNSTGFQNGPALQAEFLYPSSLLFDPNVLRGHPVLLIGDASMIRLLDLTTMEVSTYAGTMTFGRGYRNGPAATAEFAEIAGMALKSDGTLLVADRSNHAIRAIAPDTDQTVSTLMGADPTGRIIHLPANQPFNYPVDLILTANDKLIISDSKNHQVRVFTAYGSNYIETQTAGDKFNYEFGFEDGAPDAARFNYPQWMALRPNGDVLVTDRENHAVRRLYQ